MISIETIKDTARREAREILSRSTSFQLMNRAEQMDMYKDIYESSLRRLSDQNGLSKGMVKNADQMIDYNKHKNDRIDQAGDIAKNFMDGVNFPAFVRDLLKGVFDANLEVTVKQMQAYTQLMKEATASISKFVNQIDAAASFGYLAENNSDEFSFGEDSEGNQQLTDKDGNVVATAGPNGQAMAPGGGDLSDNQVKARIMDAKIRMAQEQRAILRETILMGVARLVVERGTVKAGVLFDIKAKEHVEKKDKAASKKASSSGSSISASGGFIGKIFGGPSGGYSRSDQESQISISSAKSVGDTELKAQITGSVEIIFKSDYFKLDNFATMYAAGAQGGPAAQPAQGQPALPPTAPPR